jgi:hypothetical protein
MQLRCSIIDEDLHDKIVLPFLLPDSTSQGSIIFDFDDPKGVTLPSEA